MSVPTTSPALSADDWPIAASMLSFPGTDARGHVAQDAPAEEWATAFTQVAEAGFDRADLTDSWVRPGDLSTQRLAELTSAARDSSIELTSISAIRRSVIDAESGLDNLAYSHRSIDAAAELGIGVVSFGLHQALSDEQKKRLWFWTADGHHDDPDDREMWNLAVRRFRELGTHAAEVGVLVSLEMYEDTYLGTGDSSVRLVEDIGLETVGLNPDIGNLIRLHRPVESWVELVEKTMPWANFWHVKNYQRDEDLERDLYFSVPAPLESGLMNYRWALSYAVSVGFQGVICTENYGGDGLSVCASNRDYLRRHALPKNANYVLGKSRVAQRGAPVVGRDGSAGSAKKAD
ncbi:MAG: TIM barrel protein [Lacisediminihabitans sp.]